MRCCWLSCPRKASWFVTSSWSGVVNFVICDEHMTPITNAYPEGEYVLGALGQASNRKSNDTTNRDTQGS